MVDGLPAHRAAAIRYRSRPAKLHLILQTLPTNQQSFFFFNNCTVSLGPSQDQLINVTTINNYFMLNHKKETFFSMAVLHTRGSLPGPPPTVPAAPAATAAPETARPAHPSPLLVSGSVTGTRWAGHHPGPLGLRRATGGRGG